MNVNQDDNRKLYCFVVTCRIMLRETIGIKQAAGTWLPRAAPTLLEQYGLVKRASRVITFFHNAEGFHDKGGHALRQRSPSQVYEVEMASGQGRVFSCFGRRQCSNEDICYPMTTYRESQVPRLFDTSTCCPEAKVTLQQVYPTVEEVEGMFIEGPCGVISARMQLHCK